MTEQTQMVNYVGAIGLAMAEEMRRDERVVMWGEDIASVRGGFGETAGVYKTQTSGILEEFGENRIKNTPIIEQAIAGMTTGAALTGLRPIAFILTAGFLAICLDALFMEIGTLRQSFYYRGPLPLVISARAAIGGGSGAHHCASTEALLIHSPGLKVVMPSTPYDAKGLMKSAIRDDEPVIFIAHGPSYFTQQEIPIEEYLIPLGQADVKREGDDVTIVAYSGMVPKVLAAAETLSKEGISAEVVDLRTLVPMDVEAIVKSVKKTGRLFIAHEAMKRGGVAGEIAFRVTEAAPDVMKALKTPIRRLAAKNLALPRSPVLEAQLLPHVEDVATILIRR